VAGGVASEAARKGISHQSVATARTSRTPASNGHILGGRRSPPARTLTAVEGGIPTGGRRDELCVAAQLRRAPVLGMTGKGDSGKSVLADEPMGDLDIEGTSSAAVLAVDPTRRRAGGALLASLR
jgi:isobutyryl-CoA mutase